MLIPLKQVLVICFLLLNTVSSELVVRKGSDGRNYAIDTAPKFNLINVIFNCGRLKKQILSIDSVEKRDIITKLLQDNSLSFGGIWLGIHDAYNVKPDKKRTFYSLSTGRPTNYENFKPGSPDNISSDQHCVFLLGPSENFRWDDTNCKKKLGYICEDEEDV